nr:hypothetical protein CFP56_11958 [Quercus suber]
MPGQPVTHHEHLEEWKHSVQSACPFCTLLMEHVKDTIESAVTAKEDLSRTGNDGAASSSPTWVPIKPDPERDARVRNNTLEKLLLDWVSEREETIRKALPLFEAVLQDGGAGNAWYLKFQPLQKNSAHDDQLALPSQRFSVYATEYDGVSDQEVRLEGNTKSEATLSQLRSWIKGCEKHRHCGHLHRVPAESEYVPTRLLDVGRPGEPYLRLVETGNSNVNKHRPYVTLSKLTPATFRDAVSVTRSLGVRYLWIDALCMLQNNPEEWLRESPMMQEIYCNALIGLAAVSADNCDQGLFRERTGAGATPCEADVTWAHQSLPCRVVRDDFWKGEILSEPLYKRGWVLQERMLAPRILHFQRRQVFWQCPSLTACESAPGGLSTIVPTLAYHTCSVKVPGLIT